MLRNLTNGSWTVGAGGFESRVVGLCDGNEVGLLNDDIEGDCDGDGVGARVIPGSLPGPLPGPLPGRRRVGIIVASSLTGGDIIGDGDVSYSVSVVGTSVGSVVVVISIVDGD